MFKLVNMGGWGHLKTLDSIFGEKGSELLL